MGMLFVSKIPFSCIMGYTKHAPIILAAQGHIQS